MLKMHGVCSLCESSDTTPQLFPMEMLRKIVFFKVLRFAQMQGFTLVAAAVRDQEKSQRK